MRSLYGVDAVVLLAYDQMQFTDEGAASILNWTVVGAYVIPGEKNTTQTLMDVVVYDIKSRKLLFRAPGVSKVKGVATPVNLNEALRKNSEQGFNEADVDLIKNLDAQLASFKDRVKEAPGEYKVVNRAGYSGGGDLGYGFVLLLAYLLVWPTGYGWWQAQRTRA